MIAKKSRVAAIGRGNSENNIALFGIDFFPMTVTSELGGGPSRTRQEIHDIHETTNKRRRVDATMYRHANLYRAHTQNKGNPRQRSNAEHRPKRAYSACFGYSLRRLMNFSRDDTEELETRSNKTKAKLKQSKPNYFPYGQKFVREIPALSVVIDNPQPKIRNCSRTNPHTLTQGPKAVPARP